MQTLDAGDGERLGRLAADEGFDAVFVLGGDGTANEVVNGAGDRIPIGVLPAGGTSVLPRVLGLPRDLDEAVGAPVRRAGRGIGAFDLARQAERPLLHVRRRDRRRRRDRQADRRTWTRRRQRRRVVAARRPLVREGGDRRSARRRVRRAVDPRRGAGQRPTFTRPRCSSPTAAPGASPARCRSTLRPTRRSKVASTSSPSNRSSRAPLPDGSRLSCAETMTTKTTASSGCTTSSSATIRCDRPLPVQVDGELIGELDKIELTVVPNAARLLV